MSYKENKKTYIANYKKDKNGIKFIDAEYF